MDKDINREKDSKQMTMEQVKRAIEQKRKQMEMKNTAQEFLPLSKKDDSLIQHEHDIMKSMFIERKVREMYAQKKYHDVTIRIIRHCLYQNFMIINYLQQDASFSYSHTAYLLYKMFETKKFNEEDYIAAGKLKLDNALMPDLILLELIEKKKQV